MTTVILAVIILGAVGYFVFQRSRQRTAAATAWASAEGLIVASAVDQRRDTDGAMIFTPNVAYTYPVNGTSHTGRRIAFKLRNIASKKAAGEVCARYPVGAAVTVYYDPAKPSDCVLERGA